MIGPVLVLANLRGRSSVGRAVALQATGHRFDPGRLHRNRTIPPDGGLDNSCRALVADMRKVL